MTNFLNESFNHLIDMPFFLFVTLSAFVGLLVGSFLNVVIVRLPIMMQREESLFIWQYEQQNTSNAQVASASNQAPLDVVLPQDLQGKYTLYTPASHCPQCKAAVRWWMNIPILSYLFLKGRCASCKAVISWQYPVVECVAAILAIAVALSLGASVNYGAAMAMMLLLWALLALTVIDFNTQYLPDAMTFPLMWLGLLFNTQALFAPLSSAVWGAMAGYISLWSVCYGYKWLTGKQGMGHGDFKLMAALGAWLGVTMVLPIILFASFAGALIGGALIATRRVNSSAYIAFGPYLAMAGGVCALYGHRIVDAYWAYARFTPQ
jgi:leader peptidase (prepilin peptidase) / N-methyltransferase